MKVTEREGWLVEELSALAGTTVRNLRAFQDKGIIPPPAKRGRQAVYGEAHLYRLQLLLRLQSRGYSLNGIKELIDAAEQGRNVRELIGLDTVITTPLMPSNSTPGTVTNAQLLRMFGYKRMPKVLLRQAVDLGFLLPEGRRYRVGEILMLEAAADLVKNGIELTDLLEIARRLRENMDRMAEDITWRLAKSIDSYGSDIPPQKDMPRIAALIQLLRRLVDPVLLFEGKRAIESASADLYKQRLSRTIDQASRKLG